MDRNWILPLLLMLFFGLPTVASAAEESDACAVKKDQAAARYYNCITRHPSGTPQSSAWAGLCERRLERQFRRADRLDGCGLSGGAAEFSEAFSELSNSVQELVSTDQSLDAIVLEKVCNPEDVNLLDFEVWRRENGYWVGEYTFLGADGNPNQSASWPYRYDQYKGFIALKIEGNRLIQRNVFAYPPQDSERCTGEEGDVKGDGTCGIHGNEKIFSADQTASDCRGNLAGPFVTPFGTANTFTTIIEPDTVVYRVQFPDPPFLLQNQLTTLPNDQIRIRSAQGFSVPTQETSYLSYYRERKVTREEFYEALEQARADYNILPSDECGYDGTSNGPTGIDCETHFSDTE